MRYLTVIPDYTGSCIKDDYAGLIEIDELQLPKDYIDEINSWHAAYRKIIPLCDEQRELQVAEINRLDEQGLKLSKKLSKLVPGGAKVKYFSEGLMKYLPVIIYEEE
ncbi:MAG TPA: hypothetical protein ENJ28_08595 [Gammaproteobacteria bacterium]|nr:hypothetical protein [Gammaproteobacteria bacterium]